MGPVQVVVVVVVVVVVGGGGGVEDADEVWGGGGGGEGGLLRAVPLQGPGHRSLARHRTITAAPLQMHSS